MGSWNAPANGITWHRVLVACATALAAGFTVSPPQPTHAAHVTPPDVPASIRVLPPNNAFLEGHAAGTQNYVCLPCPNPTTPASSCPDASGFACLLFTPEATLIDDHGKQVTTHFFSPNPADDGAIRATWQDSRDSSIVWGGRAISAPVPDGIPWLLLPMAGTQKGPTGGDTLTETTFIQRVHTAGGLAPSDGCSRLADVGAKAFVPYVADYFFYRNDDESQDRGR